MGYEPGVKIREDTFQNTWNVVLVLGDWWPVQCNWGARSDILYCTILYCGGDGGSGDDDELY